MKVKYKKELKLSENLVVGDLIKVGGLMAEITKIEDIHHHVPESRIRLNVIFIGATSKNMNGVVFFPNGLPIKTFK